MKNYFQYIILFITGAVILIVEIAGAKLLAPFYGSTIFVWSSMITVTMGFLALGYFAGGVLADKYPQAKWYYFWVSMGGLAAVLLLKFSYPILLFSEKFGFKGGALAAALMIFALPLAILSMAGPFVIRLKSHGNDAAGHVSGIVFGISTLGSLVGALLVGFYLIPNFFLPDIFIYSLFVLVLFSVFGIVLEKAPVWMIILPLVCLVIFFMVPFFEKKNEKVSVLYHEPSFYGDVKVIEHGGLRCLEVNNSAQTCVDIRTDKQISPYGAMINALIRDSFIPRQNLLVLGLGGGVIARDLYNKYEYNSVDTVEIDPKVAYVAGEFFGYDDSSERVNTFIGDARNYLRNVDKKYDVIVLDAFSGASPASHLYTKEAFIEMKKVLSSRGVLIVNSIGRPYGKGDILSRSIYRTISEVFAYNHVFSTQNVSDDIDDIGNVIFMSSLDPKKVEMREEYVVSYSDSDDKARILSDFLNPIGLMSALFVDETQRAYRDFINLDARNGEKG